MPRVLLMEQGAAVIFLIYFSESFGLQRVNASSPFPHGKKKRGNKCIFIKWNSQHCGPQALFQSLNLCSISDPEFIYCYLWRRSLPLLVQPKLNP